MSFLLWIFMRKRKVFFWHSFGNVLFFPNFFSGRRPSFLICLLDDNSGLPCWGLTKDGSCWHHLSNNHVNKQIRFSACSEPFKDKTKHQLSKPLPIFPGQHTYHQIIIHIKYFLPWMNNKSLFPPDWLAGIMSVIHSDSQSERSSEPRWREAQRTSIWWWV